MKLWELETISRWSKFSIKSLIQSEKWRDPFGRYFDDFRNLVNQQNRDVLDMAVPVELSGEACSIFEDLLFAIDERGSVRLLSHSCAKPPGYSARFIHDNFGGAVMEDAIEKGSYPLPRAVWERWVEQCAAAKPVRVLGD